MAGELENDFGIKEVREGKLISPYKNGDWSEDFTTLKPHFQEAITDIKSWFMEGWEPVAYMVYPLPLHRLDVALRSDNPPIITTGLFKKTRYLDLPETLSPEGTRYIGTSTSYGDLTLEVGLYRARLGSFPQAIEVLNQDINRIAVERVKVLLFGLAKNSNGRIDYNTGIYVPSRIMVTAYLFDALIHQLDPIEKLEAEERDIQRRLTELKANKQPIIDKLLALPVLY